MTNNILDNMNTHQSNIERIVMQRVYLIRALRFAISSGMFSLMVFALALWGVGKNVWIAQVFHNAPTHTTDLPLFYLGAFMHTSPVVQILILLSLVALFFVARESMRAIAFIKAQESF